MGQGGSVIEHKGLVRVWREHRSRFIEGASTGAGRGGEGRERGREQVRRAGQDCGGGGEGGSGKKKKTG